MDPTRTQDELDQLRGRMAEADFWFGEHSIPQYELLVREGLLSQAEADDYRSQRAEMGLPMTFAELEPAPHPAFQWVKAAGGPSMGPEQTYELSGMRWEARVLGESGLLQAHDHRPDGNPDGYLAREVRPTHDGVGVGWSAVFKIADGVWARRSGKCQTFGQAVSAAAAIEFKPIELAGFQWYATSEGAEPSLVAAIDGAAVEIRPIALSFDGDRWFWERSLPEGSAARRLAGIFNADKLSAYSGTRDQAIGDAIASPGRLLGLAGSLLGDDQFEAGRQAGITAARAALLAL